jgi:RNA polymerase sigma-70 factor (ECF subfamily)
MTSSDLSPEQWVNEHGDALYSFAMTRVKNPSAAKELIQETFLAALENRTGFEGRSSVRTWLISILRNKIVDAFRAGSLRTDRVEEAEEATMSEDRFFESEGEWDGHWREDHLPKEWKDPHTELERTELRRLLEACVELLPRRHASVFLMKEFDGEESGAICSALGISLSNFWVILHRSRLALRECVEQKWSS